MSWWWAWGEFPIYLPASKRFYYLTSLWMCCLYEEAPLVFLVCHRSQWEGHNKPTNRRTLRFWKTMAKTLPPEKNHFSLSQLSVQKKIGYRLLGHNWAVNEASLQSQVKAKLNINCTHLCKMKSHLSDVTKMSNSYIWRINVIFSVRSTQIILDILV